MSLSPQKRDFYQRWQKNRCYLCGRGLNYDFRRPDTGAALTVDHVRPLCHGSSLGRDIALAHRRCNMDKGSRLPYACERMYADVAQEAWDMRCELIGLLESVRTQWRSIKFYWCGDRRGSLWGMG